MVAVTDGVAGRDAALAAPPPFDLVITNSHMPHMSGAELVAELRVSLSDLPILHLDDLSETDLENLAPDVPSLYSGSDWTRSWTACDPSWPSRLWD